MLVLDDIPKTLLPTRTRNTTPIICAPIGLPLARVMRTLPADTYLTLQNGATGSPGQNRMRLSISLADDGQDGVRVSPAPLPTTAEEDENEVGNQDPNMNVDDDENENENGHAILDEDMDGNSQLVHEDGYLDSQEQKSRGFSLPMPVPMPVSIPQLIDSTLHSPTAWFEQMLQRGQMPETQGIKRKIGDEANDSDNME